MPVELKVTSESVVAYLSGEIDHHFASQIRNSIDIAVHENRPSLLVLDFGGVSFMDSSGIGLVMGRYRLVKEYGGKIRLQNTPPHIARVMKLSGVDRLCQSGDEKKEVLAGEGTK